MTISWSLLQFFTKLYLSPQTTLLDKEIYRCLSYSTFWSTKSLEIWQKLLKMWKLVHFEVFVIFGRMFCVFFQQKTLSNFYQKPLFLVERLHFSKPPSFSKSTENLHKIFKNLIFLYFCQFRSEFDAFFLNKLLLPLQNAPGQQSVSLLNVCEILSHHGFKKIHKNWIKFSKIWTF